MKSTFILLLILFCSCSPLPVALLTEGQIINSEPDRIYVIFRDALIPDRYTGGWFYVPGEGIVNKDAYGVNLVLTPKFQIHD